MTARDLYRHYYKNTRAIQKITLADNSEIFGRLFSHFVPSGYAYSERIPANKIETWVVLPEDNVDEYEKTKDRGLLSFIHVDDILDVELL